MSIKGKVKWFNGAKGFGFDGDKIKSAIKNQSLVITQPALITFCFKGRFF